jgi:hypothetical protein
MGRPVHADATVTLAARRPPFIWAAIACSAFASLLYIFGALQLARHGASVREFGWNVASRDGRFYIARVDPAGAAAGQLQAGDVIVAINGDTRVQRVPPGVKTRAIRVGDPYTIRVIRDSRPALSEAHEPDSNGPLETTLAPRLRVSYEQLAQSLTIFLVSLTWFAVATMVAVLKPDSGIARLAFAAGLAQALILLRFSLGTTASFLEGSSRLIYYLVIFPVTPLQLAIGYHFYYRFPPGVPRGWFWSALLVGLYASSAIFGVVYRGALSLIGVMSENSGIEFYLRHGWWLERLAPFDSLIYPIAGLAMAAVVVRNYRLVAEPDRLRRLKWLLYGAAAGLGPFICEEIISASRVAVGLPPLGRGWFVIGNGATVLIPVSFGYAIIKHRVFDINVVVRRGVQYLLARNALRLILSLPILALAAIAFANRHLTLAEVLSQNASYLLLMFGAAASLRYRSQLTAWVDRKFFREAYDREQILFRLLEEIGRIDRLPEIAANVSRELEAVFHPKAVYVWYRQDANAPLKLGYSSGSHPKVPPVGVDDALVAVLERTGSILDVPVSGSHPELAVEQQQRLQQWNVELVVPIGGGQSRLFGMLMLGEKVSEEPYSGADRKLLGAVASQMAIVADKAQLLEHVDRGRRIERDVLARVHDRQLNLVKTCPTCGVCYDLWNDVCGSDGAELTLSLPVERTIDGKYRLDRLIGQGGMGAVYEAADLRLDRSVAVKIMLGRAFGDQAAIRRFEREARAVARLNHPRIISLYDYGAIGAEGAYMVMELLHGVTLRAEMARLGVLPPAVTADWFDQVLDGIEAAHDQQVVHRDLKPENILVIKGARGGGTVKILDFGLAKVRPSDSVETISATALGDIVGTAGYMPPEQLVGDEVDARGDLFSIGVIAFEALGGRRPFHGRTSAEMLLSMLGETPHLPGESPAIRRLNDILQRCLARSPGDRFPSAAALRTELVPALRDCVGSFALEITRSDGESVTERLK